MPDYKRLVSYMYNYEDGMKKNNVGYARVEARNGQCKCTLHIAAPSLNDKQLKAYIFKRRKGGLEGILLGTFQIRNGIGDYKTITDPVHIMNSSYGLDDMGGIILYLSERKFFATSWDDIPITMDMVAAIESKKYEKELQAANIAENHTVLPIETEASKQQAEQQDIKAAAEYAEQNEGEVFNDLNQELKSREVAAEKENSAENKVPGEELDSVVEIFQNEKVYESNETSNKAELNLTEIQNRSEITKDKKIPTNLETKGTAEILNNIETKDTVETPNNVETDDIVKILNNMETGDTAETFNNMETGDTAEIHNDMESLDTAEILNNMEMADTAAILDNMETRNNADELLYEEDFNNSYEEDNTGEGKESNLVKESLDIQSDVKSEGYPRNVEKQPFFEDHPVAKKIYRSFPRMYPFEDNEIAWCVRIEPQDIGLFPMEAWILGNNSFLLHGYYSYRHLIFARMNDKNGFSYILGVPGIYHNREKFMAKMFGFENFKCVKRKAQRTGEFGYWYIPITLN